MAKRLHLHYLVYSNSIEKLLVNYILDDNMYLFCRQRFSQHFELLQKACIPDQVSYPLFKDSTTHARLLVSEYYDNFAFFSYGSSEGLLLSFPSSRTYDHFKDAQKIVKEVKSSFSNNPEKSAELRRLEQVAEHNSIALNIISRAGALDPSLKVTFEFNHHPYFATAVVKRS